MHTHICIYLFISARSTYKMYKILVNNIINFVVVFNNMQQQKLPHALMISTIKTILITFVLTRIETHSLTALCTNKKKTNFICFEKFNHAVK